MILSRQDDSQASEKVKPPFLHRELFPPLVYVFLLTLVGITYENELSWTRAATYLAASTLLCLPVCVSYGIIAMHLSRLHARMAGVLSVVGSALLSAGSVTVLVYGVDRLFRTGFVPNKTRDPYVLALAGLFLCVSLAQYAMVRRHKWNQAEPRLERMASNDVPNARTRPATTFEGLMGTSGAGFFGRLPAALGRDIVYLKMNDHYVEVFTTKGRAMLLMRFADAVKELDGLGMRVHRSYWVAHGHVNQLLQRGRRKFILVTGGHEVPVSRTHLPAIESILEGRQQER